MVEEEEEEEDGDDEEKDIDAHIFRPNTNEIIMVSFNIIHRGLQHIENIPNDITNTFYVNRFLYLTFFFF